MPSKRKAAGPAAEAPELKVPKELLDELVKGPMTQGDQVDRMDPRIRWDVSRSVWMPGRDSGRLRSRCSVKTGQRTGNELNLNVCQEQHGLA